MTDLDWYDKESAERQQCEIEENCQCPTVSLWFELKERELLTNLLEKALREFADKKDFKTMKVDSDAFWFFVNKCYLDAIMNIFCTKLPNVGVK